MKNCSLSCISVPLLGTGWAKQPQPLYPQQVCQQGDLGIGGVPGELQLHPCLHSHHQLCLQASFCVIPWSINLHPSNEGEARKGVQTGSLCSSLRADKPRWYILLSLACGTWNTWRWESQVSREHDEALFAWKENSKGGSLFSHPHVEPCFLGNTSCNFYYCESNHRKTLCFCKNRYFWTMLILNFLMSYLLKDRKAGNSEGTLSLQLFILLVLCQPEI